MREKGRERSLQEGQGRDHQGVLQILNVFGHFSYLFVIKYILLNEFLIKIDVEINYNFFNQR